MLVAMPTKEDVCKSAAIVQDLMKPEKKALAEGRKTCAEVAQAALALADKSESEAEKLLLAKGAYNLYAHEGSFDKAVGAMKTLRDMIPDLSPQVVANIIESSFGDVSNTNDVRLCGLLEEAKTCVRYQDELAAILVESEKDPRNGALHLRIAEKYAFLGPWTKAVEEFTKGDDRKAAAMAEAEREVRVGLAAKEIADFWWDYPAQRGKELERAFRLHAAEIYRRLLVEGALAGLDKVQAERRVEEAKKYAALFFQRGGWFGIGVKRLKVSLAGDVELELIRCPAGEFTMGYRCWEKYGSPYNRESRKVHQVKLTRDFFLGRFPVTYAQWHAVMKKGNAPPGGLADVPAGNITVPEMEAFCEKLTERFGRYLDGRVFRLPTEAEWENAASGPNHQTYAWGNESHVSIKEGLVIARFNFNGVVASAYLKKDPNRTVTYYHEKSTRKGEQQALKDVISVTANGGVRGWVNHKEWTGFIYTDLFRDLSAVGGFTTPVDYYQKGKNAYGNYDMCGNCWEWTSSVIKATNGAESGKDVNAIRGGSWYANMRSC